MQDQERYDVRNRRVSQTLRIRAEKSRKSVLQAVEPDRRAGLEALLTWPAEEERPPEKRTAEHHIILFRAGQELGVD
jgi:hypothetical protein